MSKAKGNTVDPQALLEKYGADTVRLFMMFAAPPEQALEWSDDGVQGSYRFLKRLWHAVADFQAAGAAGPVDSSKLDANQKDLHRKTHETIAKVSDDLGRRYTFNTAIASSMELLNSASRLQDSSPQGRAVLLEALETVVLLLSPIVPHITHELWHALGHKSSIVDAGWPMVDEEALVRDVIEIIVQVNGKLRGRVSVPADIAGEELKAVALADENVQRFIDGKAIRKVIVVPGRLVNVVV
jgi:leucyl-tRNA synthetase